MNQNLVPLNRLVRVINEKKLSHLITHVGYANDGVHKYYVILRNGKIVRFGDIRYDDYLIHGNENRRKNYRARHQNDKIDDPNYPGFWSFRVLW